jgi:muramoyltetrapeptide carboxypeptidase LdcA involved in peptidoglycan recycling
MPLRLQAGIEWLRSRGATVELMPSAGSAVAWPTPAARARDLIEGMRYPIPGVVAAAVGGNGSIGVLRELEQSRADWPTGDCPGRHLHGGSDVTALLWWAHHRFGTPTYYGPGVALGLAEQPAVREVTAASVLAAWSGAPSEYIPQGGWTEERVPFAAGLDALLTDQIRRDTGPVRWRALQHGTATGLLLPACLEVLVWWLRGLPCWSLLNRGPVLLALDIALTGSRWGATTMGGPVGVDALLHSFALAGGWEQVAGVLVGRPRGYLLHESEQLDEVLLAHVPEGVPLLVDIDLGHTEPSLTIPFGRSAELRTDPPGLQVRGEL